MEVIKDYIRKCETLYPVIQRKMLEFDCIIPDNMPDATQISVIEARPIIEDIRTDNTFTVADITVNYAVIYICDNEENSIKSFTVKGNHTITVDIPGVNSSVSISGTATIENTEFTLINSRKTAVKSDLRLDLFLVENEEQGLAIDLADAEKIKSLTSNKSICTCTENVKTTCDVASNIELPGIKKPFEKLIRSAAQLSDLIYTVTADQLQIRGNLSICTIYTTQEKSDTLQILESQVPFSHIVNVDMRDEKQARSVMSCIKNYNAQIIEDSDGLQRILNVNSTIEFEIKTYTCMEYSILEDAFSLEEDIQVIREEKTFITQAEEVTGTFTIKEVIAKPAQLPGIKEIADINCYISDIVTECKEENITIKGKVICNVLYLTDDVTDPIRSFATSIGFEQTTEQRNITPEHSVAIYPEINHINFGYISSEETELRISFTARGIVTLTQSVELVTDLQINDVQGDNTAENNAPILLYIVQPGDSIWKISKKYKTDPEYLKKINRLPEPYIIYPGQKLIISK